MASNYPASLDTLTNPSGAQTLDSPDHATQHTNSNDIVESIETTLGTNSGTSVLKHFTAGQFPVRATGVAATGTLQQTIVGGTYQNTFIGTSQITGGTITGASFTVTVVDNGTLGTPTLVFGSDATGDVWFRSAGGTANRLAIGNANDVLKVSSGLPAWSAETSSNTDQFRASMGTAQVVSHNTDTNLSYDTEQYDDGADFATGTYTIPTTGLYYVGGVARISASTASGRVYIALNYVAGTGAATPSAPYEEIFINTGNTPSMSVFDVNKLSAGNLVYVGMKQFTGANITLENAAGATYFFAKRIG